MTMTIDPPRPATAPRPTRRARRWPGRLVVVGLLLAGIVLTGRPVGATFVADQRYDRAAGAVERATAAERPAVLRREIVAARRFNRSLRPEALRDPWTRRGAEGSAQHAAYLRRLAVRPAMGTLSIPAIGVHLPIEHDSTPASLAGGVGHFFGTSLPVGGRGTHAVLAAHSGTSDGSLFDRLPELAPGDRFQLRVAGETLTYRVDRVRVVLPDELGLIGPVPGRDLVTLVTCTPRLVNTHRLLVRGVRVPTPRATPEHVAAGVDLSVQEWMVPRVALSGAGVLLLALMLLGWVLGDRRRRGRVR